MSSSRILVTGLSVCAALFAASLAIVAWGTAHAPVAKVRTSRERIEVAAAPAKAPPAIAAAPVGAERAPAPPSLPPRGEEGRGEGDDGPLPPVPPSSLAIAPVPPPPRHAKAAPAGRASLSPHLSMELTDQRFRERSRRMAEASANRQNGAP